MAQQKVLARARVKTHCSEPEDNAGCDADCRHEGVGASIVAGVDAPPVLEPAEHTLDLVPLTIEHRIMFDRRFSV